MAILSLVSIVLAGYIANASAATCNTTTAVAYGSTKAFMRLHAKDVGSCCGACALTRKCVSFNFEPTQSVCYLQADCQTKPRPQPTTISGTSGNTCPPAPPAPGPPVPIKAATIELNGVVGKIDPRFKSWTIDASINRGWEVRNLSNPKIRYLAKESLPGYLRFGGSGNDGLTYGVGRANFSCDGVHHCLNESWFDNLVGLAQESGAKLVFGLNIDPRTNGTWDASQASALMQYSIKKWGPSAIFAFELGNEFNPGIHPDVAAQFYLTLHNTLTTLWPSSDERPKIIGPDVHGYHNDDDIPDNERTTYLIEFYKNVSSLGVPMFALTHHEYVEIEEHLTTPPPAGVLDMVGGIGAGVTSSLRGAGVPSDVGIWVGESGPHNGGSPGVITDNNTRWLNYADSFWYIDAMGSKARNLYGAFCRQDFVGIDYGMIDPLTNDPMPDFYTSIVWSKTMGQAVFDVKNDANNTIRAYAHCTTNSSTDLSLILINLAPNGTNCSVTLNGAPMCNSTSCSREEYHFTGPQGTNSSQVALNGVTLELSPDGAIPTIAPEAVQSNNVFSVMPASINFYVIRNFGQDCMFE